MTNRKTICIYHGNCADGFTAAWAVWKALGDKVQFVPGIYGQEPPSVVGADVIMVDFSYKRDVLINLAEVANSMLVLDHHKTAEADLDGLFAVPFSLSTKEKWQRRMAGDTTGAKIAGVFDMEKSGAMLAWEWFHPGTFIPAMVEYVQDRDLWRFKLKASKAVSQWVFSYPYDFHVWDRLEQQLASDFATCVSEGEAIERKHMKDVAELLEVTRREMVIGGHRVPVANLPYTMASDAAGKMAEDAPFAACYFDRPDARVFSLRSRGDDGLDVAEIAASYGGGGHRNAAGFQMPLEWCGDIQ